MINPVCQSCGCLKLDLDSYVFKKSWNKLHYYQKKNRLNNYIDNSLLETNNKNKMFIKNQLLDLLDNKKLNSNKKVIYDPKNSKILNIVGLKYNNHENIYLYEK